MTSKKVTLKALLLSVVMSFSCITFSTAQTVPSPEDVYGFKGGAYYKLADYSQIEDYLSKLDTASDRVKKIEIGETVLGRKMYLMFISTAENLAQLDKWKDISTKLELALEGLIVDPQTCGPLMVSCSELAAKHLQAQGWILIGKF